jgi:hypothetical protein
VTWQFSDLGGGWGRFRAQSRETLCEWKRHPGNREAAKETGCSECRATEDWELKEMRRRMNRSCRRNGDKEEEKNE